MARARLQSSSPFSARDSPRARRTDDSPSRQLQFELERALSQIHLHEIERSKLHAYQKRQQQEELDARELAQAEAHRVELNAAKAQHEVVRKQAEAVLQAYIKQEEEERQRREEEERRRLEEEERRRKAEAEAKAQAREKEQARKRAEEERKAREEKERQERQEREERARQEADRQAKQKAEREEQERREKEAAEQKQREEKARAEQEAASRRQDAEKAAAAKVSTPQPTPLAQGKNIRATSEVETQHANYLVLHKKLKKFRSDFWVAAKKDPALKPHVGDMRRAIRISVGQLTDDKVGNKKAHDRVRSTLQQALKDRPSPPVSVSEYLPAHLNLGDNGTIMIPSLALYLLSIFSKAVIGGYVGECAVNPKAAEPIGTLVAQIFSMPELQFPRSVPSTADPSQPSKPTSVSLISVLMSKFHATAPILFGINGRESTAAGKHRLGWRLDRITDDPDSKKAFVNENKHYDRLTGLGVGYASIALRNFSKAKVSNPWPPVHYWASLAHIANTPPQEVQTSHLVLLKSMLENNAIERFVLFFGAAGIAALRQAAVDFPRALPRELQEKPATKTLVLMVDSWKKEKNFSLA